MKLSMDKPVCNNGYTLVEMLIVLFIVSIFMVSSIAVKNVNSLSVFMEKMMSYCVLVQEKAFVEKSYKSVSIYNTMARFDGFEFEYPDGVVCEPCDFFYNPKGNISKPDTIICHNKNGQTRKLIFQLGSGRVRIE